MQILIVAEQVGKSPQGPGGAASGSTDVGPVPPYEPGFLGVSSVDDRRDFGHDG